MALHHLEGEYRPRSTYTLEPYRIQDLLPEQHPGAFLAMWYKNAQVGNLAWGFAQPLASPLAACSFSTERSVDLKIILPALPTSLEVTKPNILIGVSHCPSTRFPLHGEIQVQVAERDALADPRAQNLLAELGLSLTDQVETVPRYPVVSPAETTPFPLQMLRGYAADSLIRALGVKDEDHARAYVDPVIREQMLTAIYLLAKARRIVPVMTTHDEDRYSQKLALPRVDHFDLLIDGDSTQIRLRKLSGWHSEDTKVIFFLLLRFQKG